MLFQRRKTSSRSTVLSSLLKQESKLSGTGGVDLIVSFMKVVDLLFHRLMDQVSSSRSIVQLGQAGIKRSQAESDGFFAEIDELQKNY